jgi:hypothetical protein
MSEDSIPAVGEAAPAESPAPAKTVRRVSNPRPKKKVAKKTVAESPVEAAQAAEPAPVEAPAPAASAAAPVERESAPVREEAASAPEASAPREESQTAREESSGRGHWPEPETIQGEAGSAGGKRKRRRKKKGGNPGTPVEGHAPRPAQPVAPAGDAPSRPQQSQAQPPQQQQQQQPQRPSLDADEVAKHAWKIYLSEVSEEGLALIGDNDARDLTRRSFRLAEIFLEEKARRTR